MFFAICVHDYAKTIIPRILSLLLFCEAKKKRNKNLFFICSKVIFGLKLLGVFAIDLFLCLSIYILFLLLAYVLIYSIATQLCEGYTEADSIDSFYWTSQSWITVHLSLALKSRTASSQQSLRVSAFRIALFVFHLMEGHSIGR